MGKKQFANLTSLNNVGVVIVQNHVSELQE